MELEVGRSEQDHRPRLCLFTTSYAPSKAIGGRRCERIAASFHAAGWDVTVVCPAPRWMEGTDASIVAPEGPEVIYTQAALPRPLWWALKKKLGRGDAAVEVKYAPEDPPPNMDRVSFVAETISRLRALPYLGLEFYDFPDLYAGWVPFAVHAVRGRSFDVVMASLPAFSAAVAARRVANRCGARLVLDYRDPWSDQKARLIPPLRPSLLARHFREEGRCLARADLVVGVTQTICDWLAPRTTNAPILLPNGFSRSAAPPSSLSPQDDARVLLYAGSLAYGRSLTPVFEAMAAERDAEGPPWRLDYVGIHGQQAIHQAEAADATELLRVVGPLPHIEALETTRMATAAVVIVSSNYTYALPGKIFEILGVNTPMLLIAPKGCDADRFVTEHDVGWSRAAEDVAGIKQALTALATGTRPTFEGLESLTAEATSTRYEAMVRELLR